MEVKVWINNIRSASDLHNICGIKIRAKRMSQYEDHEDYVA